LSAHHCGEVKSVALDDGEHQLYADDLPPQIVASPGFANMFLGAIEAMLVVTRTNGEVTPIPAEHGLAFRVRVLR
jgi:hypothetical protein